MKTLNIFNYQRNNFSFNVSLGNIEETQEMKTERERERKSIQKEKQTQRE